MPLISSIEIENFRCFRKRTQIKLGQATYLIGVNNSGKTSMLMAFRCFFDPTAYKSNHLNQTEYAARRTGYNKTAITIEFDLTSMDKGATRKKRLVSEYGEVIKVTRTFTYREASDSILIEYIVAGKKIRHTDDLDKDLQHLLASVSVSYIHPQEGAELLAKAQDKFKERLFNNWGRHNSVTTQLQQVQDSWKDLRKTANTYLSSALTNSLKKMWPGSSAIVNLPENIEDIVQVSEISFKSSPSLPEINLTEQGTGAQSTVLYQTHYVLDSDRSLHRGFYAPTWLLEEPESFLHTDISVKLGQHLNSKEWLKNIQMIISTHSPVILAASKAQAEETRWVVFKDQLVNLQKDASEVSESEINDIGQMMGDPNFGVYFFASKQEDMIFIEDERPETKEALIDAGVSVTLSLKGTSDIKKHLDIFLALPDFVKKSATFILDNDKGIKEFKQYFDGLTPIENSGFRLYKLGKNIQIVLMPANFAAEDLFEEFDAFLGECVDAMYNADMTPKKTIPYDLTRAAAKMRGKDYSGFDDIRSTLKATQDVKDKFWIRVEEDSYKINSDYSKAIKELLGLT